MKFSSIALPIISLLAIVGCSKSDPTEASAHAVASASTAPSPPPSASPSVARAAASAPSAAPTTDYELSGAGASWKGFVLTGPKDCKVMADGVNGARLAQDGIDVLDVVLMDQRPLKETKSNVEHATQAFGDQKVTWLVSDDSNLEWKLEGYGSTTWYFAKNIAAGSKKVRCSNELVGAKSEAAFAEQKAVCASFRKK